MLYRSLLQGLTDACDAELGSEILALHRLDGKAQLSKEVSSTVYLECQQPLPLRHYLADPAPDVQNCECLVSSGHFLQLLRYNSGVVIRIGCLLQVMKHSRTHKIALIVNLNQLLGSLRATALKLPPCSEEMQVHLLASSVPNLS